MRDYPIKANTLHILIYEALRKGYSYKQIKRAFRYKRDDDLRQEFMKMVNAGLLEVFKVNFARSPVYLPIEGIEYQDIGSINARGVYDKRIKERIKNMNTTVFEEEPEGKEFFERAAMSRLPDPILDTIPQLEKIPSEIQKQIQQMYQRGVKRNEIARRFRMNKVHLNMILIQMGLGE